MALTATQRAEVIQLAGNRCEYCHIRCWELTVDHVVPQVVWRLARVVGQPPPPFSPDDLGNLAAACWACNVKKRGHTTGKDPRTGMEERLFHARQDRWDDHFMWLEDCLELVGVTPVGRATVARLELNRGIYVEQRRVLRAAMRAGEPPWP